MASNEAWEGRRSRRSWFDAPPLTTLNSPGCAEAKQPGQQSGHKKRSLDSVENLTLTHFTAPPRIDFGSLTLGRTKVRTLLIRNPHDYEQEVIVERFPYKKKFMIEFTRFVVQPSEVFSLEIFWTPEEACGVREMIQFHINDVYRLQAFLFGSAEKPKQQARRGRKKGLGPRLRQQPSSVLQTPALTSIKSSYSPRRSEEARTRNEEADLIEQEKNKENFGSQRNIENKTEIKEIQTAMFEKPGSIVSENSCRAKNGETLNFQEHKVVSTPTPLESTTIMPRQEKEAVASGPRCRKQWRGISDGTSAILNTMSPIPLSEGNEHGITVDSYYQPNDTSVFKHGNTNAAGEACRKGQLGETFAKPQLPFNADRRSTTTLPSSTFTSKVGELLHPDLTEDKAVFSTKDQTLAANKTSLPGDATYGVNSAASKTQFRPEMVHTVTLSPAKASRRASLLSPQTPLKPLEGDGGMTQASPNTMLNESLSLISRMRVPNHDGCVGESPSSSPNDVNASLSCSIISQGLGMVSPDSFMEDMKNASMNLSQRLYTETNTSTPNLPGATNAPATSLAGTPGKPRPPSTRFGPKRRSLSSQYQREQAKKVADTAKTLARDKDALGLVAQTSISAGLHSAKHDKRRKLQDQNVHVVATKQGQFASTKTADLKRQTFAKKKFPCMKSPPKRLRKEAIVKKNKNNSPEPREFLDSHSIDTCVAPAIKEEITPLSSKTPDSKPSYFDSHTVVKSRSFEHSSVTEGGPEVTGRELKYFPDIFSNDKDVDSANTRPHDDHKQQLCPGQTVGCEEFDKEIPDSSLHPKLHNLADQEAYGNTGVCVRETKFDRAIAAVERISAVSSPQSSPNKFHPMSSADLSRSPCGMTLDQGRRSTLTVTKSRPSDALLAAMSNRKRLFEETSTLQAGAAVVRDTHCVGEDAMEMEENVEVKVKETYEERHGKVYVVVEETTCVTKSTTDTYIEQVSVEGTGASPGQFCTPTRLPDSPDPQFSRRSTHVLRSPKIIDKEGLRTKKLIFSGGKEIFHDKSDVSNANENPGNGKDSVAMGDADEDIHSTTKSDTFEKEPTFLADPDHTNLDSKSNTFEREALVVSETTDANSVTIKSETFEKESPAILESTDDKPATLASDRKVVSSDNLKPITAVCAMSPRLVDYDDCVSEDGASGGNITRDSLDTTTQSADSLENGAAGELTTPHHQASFISQSIEALVSKNTKACEVHVGIDKTVTESIEPESSSTRSCEGRQNMEASSESEEEDRFYDTLSQRYYDALSDTVDADLEEELNKLVDAEVGVVSNKCLEPDMREFVKEDIGLPSTLVPVHKIPPSVTDSSTSVEHQFTAWSEAAIDRKEEFMLQQRRIHHRPKVLEISEVDIFPSSAIHSSGQRKLRRSLSADQLAQPVTFSVDVSDLKSKTGGLKCTKPHERCTDNVEPTNGTKNLSKFENGTSSKPTNQPRVSRERHCQASDSKHRSQSLSNLQRLKTKKSAGQPGERVSAKSTLNSGVKTKKMQKGVAQSRLILVKQPKSGVPRHPMPFAARNMYYDERWMEKQERGFVQWLNFVLTPPDEYVAATNKSRVNAGSLALDSHQVAAQLAPTKEVLSFRAYAARRRLNRLRRQACQLYQSERVVSVIRKVEVEVESRRIAMRKDKMAHADLGIKQRLLDLLLQYSSLWLRVGLETIFGEMLMLQSNQDVLGLSRYIVTRLLSSPDIAAEFAHPTVPHLYRDGYAAAVSRHTVKKFLLLVYFMDYAKTSRLIDHDPCLFCKDAEIKSSKEILVQFSREVLSGEGDITRHLAYLGYTVSQVQRPIDEFDFAVKSLSADLRDGLRLCRVLEHMSGEHAIMGRLRTPAISRLQKVHNMEEFYKTAKQHGLDLSSSGVSPRDVVDGHREKTLGLLWQIIIFFQSSIQVNEKELREEVRLLGKSLQLKLAMQKIGAISVSDCKASRDSGAGDTRLLSRSSRLQLILQWCRLVCLHYGVKVENFTVSFSDGRALCCLVHHYHPALLPLDLVKFQTTISHQEEAAEREMQEQARRGLAGAGDDSDASMDWGTAGGGLLPGENDPEVFDQLLANEKSNFKTLYEKVSALGGIPLMLKSADMSNTIPDEKVVSTYVSYLCARLLDIREEVRAARHIQMAWRRHLLRRALRERQRQVAAAKKLQRWIRPILARRLSAKREGAAVKIQALVRRYLARQTLRRLREHLVQQELKLQQERAALRLQTAWRGHVARQHCQTLRVERERKKMEQEQAQAAVTLQRFFRGWRARREVTCQRSAAIVLQAAWKGRQAKKALAKLRQERQLRAATVLESAIRGFLCRKRLIRLRKACLVFQKNWRRVAAKKQLENMKKERDERAAKLKFEQEMKAATMIQSVLRSFLCRKKFLKMRRSCMVIQSLWRRCLASKQLATFKAERDNKAVIIISKHFRGFVARQQFSALKQASIVVQSLWRMRTAQRKLVRLRQARDEASALLIQKVVKGFQQRRKYKEMKCAAIVLQSAWRSRQARQEVAAMRVQHHNKASVIIQKNFRAYTARQRFVTLRSSVLRLQKNWRMVLAKQKVDKMKLERREWAAIVLQKCYRGVCGRSEFLKLRLGAVTMQSHWRRIQAQKLVGDMRLKRQVQSALLIQRVWRGSCARREYKRKKRAVTCLQAVWRMRVDRQVFVKQKSAALIIQNWYRGSVEVKQHQLAYLRLRQAAICLQTAWRCKTQRESFLRTRQAIVTIQSNFRSFRRRIKFLALRLACVILQRRYRALLEGRKQRVDYKRKVEAAICIQRFFQSCQRQRHMRHTAAALLLQTVWRKTRAERAFRVQKAAAVLIQKSFREYCLTTSCRDNYLKTKSAAQTIQLAYRAHLQRRKYTEFLHGVTKLQACVRRNQARQEFIRKQAAALIIQRKYRARKLGQVFREAFLLIRTSTIKIQRFYRAVQKRRKVQREIETQRAAAIQIQKTYRSWRLWHDYLSMRQAAITLQQRYRALRAGKKALEEYKKLKQAVSVLQAWWWGCLAVREARRALEERRLEAEAEKVRKLEAEMLEQQRMEQELQLQLERQEEGRRQVLRKWAEGRRRDRAARILQRSWRGYLVMQDYVTRENAAVLIQTHVRGYLARLDYARTLDSLILLQSSIRGWVCRRHFEIAKFAATIIQQRWREVSEGRQVRDDYLKLRDATVRLQSLVRMKAQRKSFLLKVKAVTCVQASVRMYVQRRSFCHMKEKAVCLQRMVRAHQAMKRDRAAFLKLRRSAIKIQSAVRLWLAYRATQRERSAVRIQTFWRMRQQRLAFSQAYQAAQVLQSFMLMKQQQLEMQACHAAAVTIQRTFKLFLLRRAEERCRAARTIQLWFRAAHCRRQERRNSAALIIMRTLRRVALHKKMLRLRATVSIQAAVRMFLERRRYRSLCRSTALLQAAFRGFQARKFASTLRARHQAAKVIQATVRGFLLRKKLIPVLEEKLRAAQETRILYTASTKIQAWWRGHLVRRNTKSKKLIQTRKRLEEINRSATEDKTLASRTASALDYLLRRKDLAYILESLMNLETATRLSPECCERMVEVNAVGVLFRLVNSCNRSLPHMDLIKTCISILLNLAKYEKTASAVLEPPESVGTLLELMQIYRDKGIIFYRSCMLLGGLGMVPHFKARILAHPGLTEHLQSIHSLVLRKQKAAQTRQTALDKMAAMRSSYNCTLPVLTPSKSKRQPKIRPFWSMARDAMKDFEDPSTAIHFVLISLQIGAKTK